MKYVVIAIVAIAVALICYFVARARAGQTGRKLMPVIWPAVVLSLVTIVGDNIMIGSRLFSYGEDALLGSYIGLMPVEDLSYPIVAVLLASALGGARER